MQTRITLQLYFALLLFLGTMNTHAQDRSILFEGKVVDSLSNQALVFVNLQIEGSKLGTSSNLDGEFQLKVKIGDKVKFSYVGFEDKVIVIREETMRNQVIKLSEKNVLLNEFVVKPGVNPAWRIIRNALANRYRNNPNAYDSYQYTSYNKSIVHFKAVAGDNALKQRQRDSLKNPQKYKQDSLLGKLLQDEMYLWLKETEVKVAHQKPNQTKELIVAHKSSMPNDVSGGLIPTDFQPLGFYQEIIKMDVVGQIYINPLSTNCLERYDFKLENTLYQGNDTVFIVSFIPQAKKNFNGFKGLFYINSDGYALENVLAETVDTLSKLQLRVQQKSKKTDNHWFPEMLDTDLTLHMGNDQLKRLEFNIHNRSYLAEVLVNQPIPEKTFSFAQREELQHAAYQSDTHWDAFRLDSLDARERNTYVYWDSLPALQPVRNFLKIYNGGLRILATDRLPVGKVFSFRVSDFLKFNNYEGTRLGLGGQFQLPSFNRIAIGGSAGYGFKDKAWKYGAFSELKILTHSDLKARISWRKDLAEPGAPTTLSNTSSLLSALNQTRNVFRYRLDEVVTQRMDLYWRPRQGWQLNPFALQEQRKIITYDYQYGEDLNKPIFNLIEYGLNLRWAPHEVLHKSNDLESILALTFPILDAQWSKGSLDNGNRWFSKFQLNFDHQIISKTFGKSTFRISAGKIWGTVPYPYLFNAPGSKQDGNLQVLVPRTFQVAGFYEFAGDQFAAFFWEQNFGALLRYSSHSFRPSISLVQNIGFSDLTHREVHQNLAFDTMRKGYYETGLYLRDLVRVPYFDALYLTFGVGGVMRWGPYRLSSTKDNFAFQFMMGIGF